MEGTHRQLGARLADRLCGNHAHGLTGVDQTATAQVAAVAASADAEAGRAGQRGANLDLVGTSGLQDVQRIFIEHGAGGQQQLLRLRVHHFDRGDATQDTVAQRLDHFTAFDQGPGVEAVLGAAIDFGDHQVLRHVDQATRQVA